MGSRSRFIIKGYIKEPFCKIITMPISLKTDLEFGDIFYIKTDVDQCPGVLVGIVYLPGKVLKFRLSYEGDIFEVYDFETSKERDDLKAMEGKGDE